MSQPALHIAIAQIATRVGAIADNTQKILATIVQAQQKGADMVVFPELAICGYSVEDLVLLPTLQQAVDEALQTLVAAVPSNVVVIVGHPAQENGLRYNAASVITRGKVLHRYYKQCLPNNGVFDEVRYFTPGQQTLVFTVKDCTIGLLICEDGWHHAAALAAKDAGAQLLVQINASPFSVHKHQERLQVIRDRVHETGLPLLYAHMVAGQDEIIFDGGSLVMSATKVVTHQASFFSEELMMVSWNAPASGKPLQVMGEHPGKLPPREPLLYQALVFALREYVTQNQFPGVIIGLSGGIDSALTLAIAVDALGSEKVRTVSMPSRYTAELSNVEAKKQAEQLGVNYESISIEPLFKVFLDALAKPFAGLPENIAEENLQARCRGTLLMALSNKTGWLVLPTGNKSELAVGYCTLYGDMVGGFDVLKDVLKTQVYALANYRNEVSRVIPQEVIDRPPTAELRANQTDQDSLPPYEILDRIIELHLEQRLSAAEIAAQGLDLATATRVLNLIKRSEYKRQQGAIGPKISARAFGKDWRYPITSGWHF